MCTKPKVGVKIRLIRHFRELWDIACFENSVDPDQLVSEVS